MTAPVLELSEHVELALAVADRGYVLSHGVITASGESARLRANPELMLTSYLGEGAVAPRPGGATGDATRDGTRKGPVTG